MKLRLGVLVAGTVLVSTVGNPAEPPPLRVGMDTRSRPWAFVPGLDYTKENWDEPPRISPAQLDELRGLDVDFVKALGNHLHTVPKIVPAAWSHIEEGLLDKRYDVIVNAWVPNSKTPASIVASVPYCEWGLVIATKSSNRSVQGFQDLAGTRVGYYNDPVVLRSAKTLQAQALLPFDDSDSLFEALGSGRLDAVVEDSTYVLWRVTHDPDFRVAGEPLNKLGYFMAMRKEDQSLRERIDAAIHEIVQSGESEKIRQHWATGTDTPGPRG
jgi:polar amino acid transport system substrate-binding protein